MLPSSSFLCTLYQYRDVSSFLVLLLILTQLHQSITLIVPNELPSILSLVYSNIPPIKKGTDSRLGFGFRLGEHADFQVLIELGPQKETRPIGDQSDSDGSSFNKRQVNKRQLLKLQQQQEAISTERSSATWLQKWSNNISASKIKSNTSKQAGMPTMPQLPKQTLRQLQMLYKMATTDSTLTTKESVTTNGQIDAAAHLRERLKAFKAPPNIDDLQNLPPKPIGKTKTEITKELMDVSLDK